MPARPLEQLQQDFTRWLLGEPVEVVEELVDGRGLAPAQRLQVYRNMFAANHHTALATAFPMVQRLVGEKFFEGLCAVYLRDYPSTSGKLQDYGADFPGLIANNPQAASLGYLADVARLEWARQEAALAPLPRPVGRNIPASLPPAEYQNLRLSLAPSLKLVQSDYPVLDIWLYCSDPGDSRLAIEGNGQNVAIWRSGAQLSMLAIEPANYRLISRLASGEVLGAVSEAGEELVVVDTLRRLFSESLVTGISTRT